MSRDVDLASGGQAFVAFLVIGIPYEHTFVSFEIKFVLVVRSEKRVTGTSKAF